MNAVAAHYDDVAMVDTQSRHYQNGYDDGSSGELMAFAMLPYSKENGDMVYPIGSFEYDAGWKDGFRDSKRTSLPYY